MPTKPSYKVGENGCFPFAFMIMTNIGNRPGCLNFNKSLE